MSHYIIPPAVSCEPHIPCTRHIGRKTKGSSGLATFQYTDIGPAYRISLICRTTGKQMNLTKILITLVSENGSHGLSVTFLVVAREKHFSHRDAFYRVLLQLYVSFIIYYS